jgi:hypothetical protein
MGTQVYVLAHAEEIIHLFVEILEVVRIENSTLSSSLTVHFDSHTSIATLAL